MGVAGGVAGALRLLRRWDGTGIRSGVRWLVRLKGVSGRRAGVRPRHHRITRAISRRREVVALIAVPDGEWATCDWEKAHPITPVPSAIAITALRSLTITEILSVPVPTRLAMAVDRCRDPPSSCCETDRQAGHVDADASRRRSPDASVVPFAMFIGQLCPDQ